MQRYYKLAVALGLFAFSLQGAQAQEFIRGGSSSNDFARSFASFTRSLDGLASQMRADYDQSCLLKAKQIEMTNIPSEFGNVNAYNGNQVFGQPQSGAVGGGSGFGNGFGLGRGLFGGDQNDFGFGMGSASGPANSFWGAYNGPIASTLRTNGNAGAVNGSAFPAGRRVTDNGLILRNQGRTTNFSSTDGSTSRQGTFSSTDGNTFGSGSSSTSDGNTVSFGTWSLTSNAPGTTTGPGMAGTASGSSGETGNGGGGQPSGGTGVAGAGAGGGTM